jgi:hypothetical protein
VAVEAVAVEGVEAVEAVAVEGVEAVEAVAVEAVGVAVAVAVETTPRVQVLAARASTWTTARARSSHPRCDCGPQSPAHHCD